MPKTRYLLVGTGIRATMFTRALARDFTEHAELVGMCDVNPQRLAWHNAKLVAWGSAAVPTCAPHDLASLVRTTKPDALIVCSVDRTHHRYIIQGMELGLNVITEKPMTVDAEKAEEILDAIRRTGRRLRVTFNYRYAPRNTLIREVIASGAIGAVTSVHFEWLLDTNHGADYFRRWHRDKRNSGGLMVHKSTHHFDLVNWWIASRPTSVFAFGRLGFYGRENAEARGVTKFYERATGHPHAVGDPFALHLDKDEKLKSLYLDAEVHDGYQRDQSVFGNGISIEDDIAVAVRYASGASMSYHLNAHSPYEGYRVAFNGTKGRLEYDCEEYSYVSGREGDANNAETLANLRGTEHLPSEPVRILLRPHWGKPRRIDLEPGAETAGGHGGGDTRMLRDIFVGDQADPLGRAANHVDGCWSILTGIAANRSMATGLAVDPTTLVRGLT